MTPPRIRRLVEQRIGLDPDSLGASTFDAAVQTTGKSFADLEEYALALESNLGEFEKLVKRLVVSETWFFRGGTLFDFLARHVAKLPESRTAKILCLPCSTGEEPYSLAMAFMEAGIPASRWEIVGIDLSHAAIAAAQRGGYREFSFRELPAHLKAKYFRSMNGRWTLTEDVCKSVRFQAGNLFEFQGSNFDVILCRNLLIYLTPEGRSKAIDHLLTMLAPGGILGVGHAEPSAVTGRGLVPIEPHELFLFTRSTEKSVTPASNPTPRMPPTAPSPSTPTTPRVKKSAAKSIPLKVEPRCIDAVRQLADAGELAKALVECQRLIAEAPTAEAFALLGLIHKALGDIHKASDSFRKALYLDPDNATAQAMARITGGAA